MKRTASRLAVDSLRAHDIDTVYCVPGESYLGLTDALADESKIRLVVCRHEGGAVYMAVADGRLRDRAGVCVVSRGPGACNAMIGIHTAFHDASPLVVIIGQVERHDMGRMALQEQNYSSLLGNMTKAVIEVLDPDTISEAIARAFHLAESGTPGPVALVIPEDLFDDETTADVLPPRPPVAARASDEDAARLADLLGRAERPLVWVGGALATGPRDIADLERFAESWSLPVCPTVRRQNLFDNRHPNYGGYVGLRVPAALLDRMKTADLLVALGERLTDTVSQFYTFPCAPIPQLPLVHVWPDATEIGRVWHPTLGIAADPLSLVRKLLAMGSAPLSPERRAWVAELNAAQAALSEPHWDSMEDGVNFAAVVHEIGRHLEEDAIVTSDAGSFGSFVHRYIRYNPKQAFLSSVVGAMGAGVPMAVAGALRFPGRRVVAFAGDGGALMSGNELATALRYGVNPLIVISDNGCYGTIAAHHDMRYPGRPYDWATRLTNPDFALWARSFGAYGFTIAQESEVASVVAEAFAVKDKPVVLHVRSSALQMSAWRQQRRLPAE